jgi:uncharacterized protein YhaN
MTLEENIQQLRDSLTVTSAMALRHETRIKDHQQWLEDNELAYAKHRIAMAEINAKLDRTAALQSESAELLVEIDGKLTQLASAQLMNEESWRKLEAKVDAFIDSLRKGGNGHS